jgi:hypothetical protein
MSYFLEEARGPFPCPKLVLVMMGTSKLLNLGQLRRRRVVLRDIPGRLRPLYERHGGRKVKLKLAECSGLPCIELAASSKAFIVVGALDGCDEPSGARRDLIS